ncbi:MAG: peptidase M19 [Anaerolineae bacterium]|nr:peptidase M19 [Anaerolineae bacterium]
MYLIDAHQDLAWNALTFGRDYTRAAAQTRQFEEQSRSTAPEKNGDTTLGWPDYQRGRVAVVFSTLYVAPAKQKMGDWDTEFYRDYEEAHRLYMKQVDFYHRLTDDHADMFRLIQDQSDLREVLAGWSANQQITNQQSYSPVGLVILMEGAEGVREPEELEAWWARGVRLIGPAWAGTRFCGGTREPGPLTKEGYALLEGMASFGFTLDLSHMDEKAALQALDVFPGTIIASHANAAALLKDFPTNRHLPDHVIDSLLERDGVIGVVPYNSFLKTDWRRQSGSRKEEVTLQHVIAHIDYICQRAGDAKHVGIGSDFDGGFGVQSVPAEIDTIADLHKLAPLLSEKGYSDADIAGIFGLNWQRILEKTLPQ